MATKYFYTDPLKAEWMLKEFGFIICANNPNLQIFAGSLEILKDGLTRQFADKYYIAPEFYNFLKPRVNDLIKWTYKINTLEQTVYKKATKDIINAVWYKGNEIIVTDKEIIQRNGKAFFTPEKEGKNG